jgi:indole-3-glycerol phosphate synthase
MTVMMEPTFLDAIVAEKRRVVLTKKEFYARIKNQLSMATYSRYGLFKKALAKPGKLNLIAEIKKASPSKGLIREDFDVIEIAHIYHNEGVAAISVLTEEKFFWASRSISRRSLIGVRCRCWQKISLSTRGRSTRYG